MMKILYTSTTLFFLLSILPAFIINASAVTLNVNSTHDKIDAVPGDGICWTGNLSVPGECTLRAAVMETNASPLWFDTSHTINVSSGIYTLTLTGDDDTAHTGDLDITQSVIIKGAGSTQTIINGLNSDRIFDIMTGANTSIIIENLALKNGKANGRGGAICLNSGSLQLNYVAINHNEAGLTGGGIHSNDGTELSLYRCIISDNSTNLGGGGISADGVIRIYQSEIGPGNTSMGGAGGISLSSWPALLIYSTVYGNSSQGTGGIENAGYLKINSSTVSGNVGNNTGGIYCGNGSSLDLNDSTIADNHSEEVPGLETFGNVHLSIKNTLLADNNITGSQTTLNCDFYGLTIFSFQGVNLDSGDSCHLKPHDLINTSPHLGALGNNGGPTLTHELLPGSPAIDAGKIYCSDTDQRGIKRPQRTACDIGAFEQDYFFSWLPFYPAFIKQP